MFHCPEKHRVNFEGYAHGDSQNGTFVIKDSRGNFLQIIASNGDGWEHVSVVWKLHNKDTTPCWEHMCLVKDLFWGPEDTVVQFHPQKSKYVNVHPHCLHLWRKIGKNVSLPPTYMIG